MNSRFTALTRPRMAGGVAICTSVFRTTTLIMSEAPATNNAMSEITTQ